MTAPSQPQSMMETSPSSDANLFALFAGLARSAGREDLQQEFLSRAGGQIAPVRSKSPEAIERHKIGGRLVHEGKLEEALEPLREAIRLDPHLAAAHGDLGVTLARLRRLPEAEAAFRISIRLEPTASTMYVNLATCLHQQGRPADCEQWARQAIQLNPKIAEAYRLVGASLEMRNRLPEAEAAFRDALKIDRHLAEAHYGLGRVFVRKDSPVEAEAAFREAVRLNPKSPHAWSGLGSALDRLGRPGDAVEAHREAVKLEPESADRHNNLGVALASADRPQEAEAAYREALRLEPESISVLSNLGNALRVQERLEEAEAALRKVLSKKADYTEAHNNLGIVLVQAGRVEEGLKHYDEAIRLRPDYPEARMNRSLSWLAQGDYKRGWPEYEWRLKVRPKPQIPDPAPRWDGSSLINKTLIVGCEQGLGDSIHFLRYIPAIQARGGNVVFDCPPPLAALARTCPGIGRVVPRGEPLPPADYFSPLLSLPEYVGGPESSELPSVPYFQLDQARVARWKKELEGVNDLKVGIAWQGSTAHKGDRMRSVKLTRFAPLAAIPGVRLYSLQKGFGSEQLTDGTANGMEIVDLGTKIDTDLADAAAAMSALDLIVTVDTALAHLGGAAGLPVWCATAFAADWRWLREREDTPWYPTMKLFRQKSRGDWDGVFGRLAIAVAAASKEKAEGRWQNVGVARPTESGIDQSHEFMVRV